MNRNIIMAVVVLVALSAGAPRFARSATADCSPGSTTVGTRCDPEGNSPIPFSANPTESVGRSGNLLAFTAVPKVVFQINQAADASTILRFVTNYLAAEPHAEVAVVGYAGGVDFMLKGAKDAEGRLYASQLQALVERGVHFRVCNNTLKQRKLTADAVAAQATVVPGAVNEIIRLQTREGYAYFHN